MVKANPALPPLLELGDNIFRNQHSMSATANQFIFFRLALGSNQRQNRAAIGRRHRHPTASSFVAFINDQTESKLVHIEPQT